MTLSAGALRTNGGFRRYLAARVISTAGTLITAVVLPVLMYRLTGSAAWTAAAVAAEALPHLLLAPVAAPLAAGLNRRKLLFVADLAGAALLTSIPLVWWYGELSGWQVLAVACAVQAVFVLLEAAQTGALQALVGPELTSAGGVGLRGATGLVELMVPPLAGLAVAVVAPAPLLTLDAVSFLASALLVRAALRTSRAAPGPGAVPRRRVRTGLRFLRANPPSWTLVLGGALHAAAASAFLAMLLPWADRYLGVPPSGDVRLALLVSCWGLGAILGCAVAPALIRRLGPLRLTRKGMGASLLCGLGVLLCTQWLLAVLAGLLWGAAHTVTARAAIHALGRPARPAARVFWRGIGPVTGAALAGAIAVWSTSRAGLAVGIALLAAAALTTRRGVAPLPAQAVPAQSGPGQAGDGTGHDTGGCPSDCTGECAENCTTDQHLIGP